MNIAIIGGGNLGSVLAVKFSQEHNVKLYIGNKNNEIASYSKQMKVISKDENIIYEGKIDLITDDMEIALQNVELVFITYPQFLYKELSGKMLPFLKNQILVFIPGSGGAEYWFSPCLKNGCIISGLQRVHSVARLVERGKIAQESGIRKSLKIASIPQSKSSEIADILLELFKVPIEILPNYLNITLINSNPILHTSRLYCLFKDYIPGKIYDEIPLFYEHWDLVSSQQLIEMDKELFSLLNVLTENGFDMSGIKNILEHYESTNAQELTNKINTIQSFKGLTTPSVKLENGYIPDLNSRYFTADFPYGLDILLDFALICNVQCPHLQEVSDWYCDLTGTKKVFELRNFGINSLEDIKKFYNI